MKSASSDSRRRVQRGGRRLIDDPNRSRESGVDRGLDRLLAGLVQEVSGDGDGKRADAVALLLQLLELTGEHDLSQLLGRILSPMGLITDVRPHVALVLTEGTFLDADEPTGDVADVGRSNRDS